jgi:hypothetical protein
MSITDLLALVPPPDDPLNAVGDWSIAETELGIVFPSDFKEMIRRYGTGEFTLRSLGIYNPLTQSGREEMQGALDTLRVLRDACEFPLVVHPEKPGLLPWGSNSNGHIYCWWTEGTANQWDTVFVAHDDEDRPQRFRAPITEFLVNYARNKYPETLGGLAFEVSQIQFQRGRPWER